MKQALLPLATALCAAATAPTAGAAAAGLTLANYVDAADTLVDVVQTRSFTFSALMLGRLDDAAQPRLASLTALPDAPRSETTHMPCPGGGSVTGRITDRDASGSMSVQDRFVTVFNACHIGDEVMSGSSEFTITAHHFNGKVETTELQFRFKSLGSEAMRWTGQATALVQIDDKTGAERYTVNYRDLAVTRGTHAYRWTFTVEERRPPLGEHTVRINGTMTFEQAPLQLVQEEPFVLNVHGVARSGSLTATDPQGDRVQVDATPRRYRYRYFDHGNVGSAPDAMSQSASRIGR
jgi:hypothetical protein